MVERWGDAIVSSDGSLDRQAVAEIVFNDEDELKALNDLVHPAVGEEMKAQREAVLGTDAIVVLDIPLLVRADGTSDKDRYEPVRDRGGRRRHGDRRRASRRVPRLLGG